MPRFNGSFDSMSLSGLNALMAMGQPTQPGQQPPPFWTSLVPLVLLVVVFYFVLIRPQQKKQKVHVLLLKTRSEERRVGKECRYRRSTYHSKKKDRSL